MDGIVAQLFGQSSDFFLASAGALFCSCPHFQVLLGAVGDHFTQQFRKLGSVFGFFESDPLIGFCHFRIPFPVCYTAHGQVHPHFGAFPGEVLMQAFQDPGIYTFGNPDHMFIGVFLDAFFQFIEFIFRSTALRAFFRSFFSFIHITAHSANELFHKKASPCCWPFQNIVLKRLLFNNLY